jgi:hypothetical protein
LFICGHLLCCLHNMNGWYGIQFFDRYSIYVCHFFNQFPHFNE